MKRFASLAVLSAAFAVAVPGAGSLAEPTRPFTGVIHSNQCVGPACATQCAIDKEPVYSLQTEDRAWVLADPETAARYAGKKVTILGTTRGSKLTIISVKPAE